jgi:hypothetical protein
MKWSLVLWGMALGTILFLFSWGLVLFFVSPESATMFEWGLFVTTLFLSLAGLCFLLALVVRRMVFGSDRALSRIGTSVRQGMFLAVFGIGILFLRREGWLVWWDALFLFGFLFLIELFFLRKFRMR